MKTISKSSKKATGRRRVKVSELRLADSAAPAAQIEELLLREGFRPTTAKEKAMLRKNGLWGMPEECVLSFLASLEENKLTLIEAWEEIHG